MITEDYVSLEIAKLLKEKGFDEKCSKFWLYNKNDTNEICLVSCGLLGDTNLELNNSQIDTLLNDNKNGYSAPTHQKIMKWLREVHNILIVVDYNYECDTTPYYFKIYRLGENGKPEQVPVKGISYDKDDIPTEHIVGYRDWERSNDDFKSCEEASENAIKYCLENII